MFGVLANDAYDSVTLDDFAVSTNLLYRSTYFHFIYHKYEV